MKSLQMKNIDQYVAKQNKIGKMVLMIIAVFFLAYFPIGILKRVDVIKFYYFYILWILFKFLCKDIL